MRLLRSSRAEPEDRWIVAGLGNPGERYARTRHNLGAMVVESLAARAGASLKRHRSGNLAADVVLVGARAVLVRPAGYMNDSGAPVRRVLEWYKAPIDRLIVVHDELDIPFGDVRIKVGGGTAGHNGVASVASHVGTKDFVRVRVGISRPRRGRDPVAWVLEGFSAAERKALPDVVDRAADAVERIVEAGADRAMNEVNTRPS